MNGITKSGIVNNVDELHRAFSALGRLEVMLDSEIESLPGRSERRKYALGVVKAELNDLGVRLLRVSGQLLEL